MSYKCPNSVIIGDPIPGSNHIHLAHLNGYLKKTVTFSQIINWGEFFKSSGFNYSVIISPGYSGYFFGGRREIKERVEKARAVLGDCIHIIPLLKPGSVIARVLFALTVFFRYFNVLLRRNHIVFISRNQNLGLSISLLKKLFPRVKLIFDCRGAVEEEYLLSNSDTPKNISSRKANSIASILIKLIDRSDLVFFVSNSLREHYQDLSPQSTHTKSIVIPTCADSSSFSFNPPLRKTVRNVYDIEKSTVFVYSGALSKIWQIPETLFQLMGFLLRNQENSRFWCLTPDVEIAQNLAQREGFRDNQFVTKYSEYDELCSLLNASDFGLLLRSSSPVNEVAAPTKFAEYIMCGLPVIISEKIGDYSDFVIEYNCGFCLDSQDSLKESANYIKEKLRTNLYDRASIAAIGKRKLSKQLYLPKLTSVIIDLFDSCNSKGSSDA